MGRNKMQEKGAREREAIAVLNLHNDNGISEITRSRICGSERCEADFAPQCEGRIVSRAVHTQDPSLGDHGGNCKIPYPVIIFIFFFIVLIVIKTNIIIFFSFLFTLPLTLVHSVTCRPSVYRGRVR